MPEDQLQKQLGQVLVDEMRKGHMTRRQLLVRASVLGLSASFAGSLLSACGGSTSPSTSASTSASSAPRAGGTLRVGMEPPSTAPEPVTMHDPSAIALVQQVCEYLAWVENDLKLRPVLAESWKPDAAAKTWTFTLRQGVKFNDGQALTADDVVATFKRLCDPKSGSSAISQFSGILSPAGVRAVDATTVEFALDSAFVDFPYLVSSSNYNTVIVPSSYAGDFVGSPVGTGPFTLTSYTVNQGARFAKNPAYWQPGLPYLDEVELQFQGQQAQTLALQAGSIDMLLTTPYQGNQALFDDTNLNIASTPSTQMAAVAMRVDTAPFSDKGVRQAIALCLDRPALLSALYDGRGAVGGDSVFAPLFPVGVSIPQRTQDYTQAKQLLSDAGHPNGVEATLVAEQFLAAPQYAQLIQQMCKPAGIALTIDVMAQQAYYGGGAEAPWLSVPMGITNWGARAVPSQFFLNMLTSTGAWNSAHFKNAQYDTLAAQYDASLDPSSRRKIGTQMAEMQTDETPYLMAFWVEVLRATSKKVQGVEANGAEFLDLTHASLA